MEPNLIIPQSLAQAIADYLVQRPYREVANLVQALLQLQPTTPSTNLAPDSKND